MARSLRRALPAFVREPANAADDTTRPALRSAGLWVNTHFRQGASIAFAFLLVALGSIVCGQRLIEAVLVAHVKEMVNLEMPSRAELKSLDSAQRLTQHLAEQEVRPARRERAIIVRDGDGKVLYGSQATLVDRLCPDAGACHGWLRVHVSNEDNDAEWLGRSVELNDGGLLLIAYDILPMLDRMYPVPLTAGVGIFVVLLMSVGTGLYFSLHGIRRIDRIRTAMHAYSRGNTTTRIELNSRSTDEFDQLAMDINAALSRINRLMDEVRHTTNHIAHELRTPLTRLQHRLSSAIESTQDENALHEIALAQEEAERIQQIFRAVMRISEIECGRCTIDVEPIDLDGLIDDLVSYYQWKADELGVDIVVSVQPGIRLQGDRALLMQALANLIDNALKYAPRGRVLTVMARTHGGAVELGVADEGPGIAPDARAPVTKRFHRLPRDRNVPGHGLGLPFVLAVAELHRGSLVLDDNPFLDRHRLHGAPNAAEPRGLLACIRIEQTVHHRLAGTLNQT